MFKATSSSRTEKLCVRMCCCQSSFMFLPNYQTADVIHEFTLMSIQPNDQFVCSSNLPFDSSSSIDVKNEISYDIPF